mmetsp:Transcript_74697/g.167322  ORF Transcript_74697/g.167322 Transcript_74697/m.167322 type:complete len:237 (-) Transcript_74697:2016-2726(-)
MREEVAMLAREDVELHLRGADAVGLVHHLHGRAEVHADGGEVGGHHQHVHDLREGSRDDVKPRALGALLRRLLGLLHVRQQPPCQLRGGFTGGKHVALAGGAAARHGAVGDLLGGGGGEAHAIQGRSGTQGTLQDSAHHLPHLHMEALADLGASASDLQGAVLEDVHAHDASRRAEDPVARVRHGDATLLPRVRLVELLDCLDTLLVIALLLERLPQCPAAVVGHAIRREHSAVRA